MYAYLFLAIFVAKMIISVGPVFVSLDAKIVNAAIMQLEIETHSGEQEAKDSNKGKSGFWIASGFMKDPFADLAEESAAKIFIEHQLYISSFYPSVPTPPPNFS